ncbi:hypothetical protein [Seleniivibrio woodruffii]|nr:hypothetical protein [Seleniivibrio woodruffii]
MNSVKRFILAVLLVSAFSGIVGCEGGCSDANPTSPDQSQQQSN